ncbi:DUF2975 domain-containing protein [Mucilaginibacter galii]|nr:DUF2975 domain-containing protein [Mucilaginibacter galii]
MKSVHFIAKILLHLSRLLAMIYFITFVYALISLEGKSASVLLHDANSQFIIYLPFTHIPFLLGFYNPIYIWVEFLPLFILYAFFFVLLSYVFGVFTQERLFTHRGYHYLRVFYLANFTLPVIMLFLTELLSEASFDAWGIVGLHLLLGIFIFFMAAIFKQGLKLQDEQDLIF